MRGYTVCVGSEVYVSPRVRTVEREVNKKREGEREREIRIRCAFSALSHVHTHAFALHMHRMHSYMNYRMLCVSCS